MKDIIEQNKKYVRAVIRKFTGSLNEDLEQEVYIKTWQNMPKYNEQGKFKQWICTLTANLCRDYFRSGEYQLQMRSESDEHIDEMRSETRLPEEVIDAKMRQKIILKAVDALPRQLREVIVLFEFEDYSQEQIAAKLHIPLGTVKSRLFNARKQLADKLSFLKEKKDE